MPDKRIFIDSNIPMYAHGAEHPLKIPCIEVLARLAKGDILGVTSVEVVQEIVHRYLSLGRRQQAHQVAEDFVTIVPDVLPVTSANMRLVLSYIGQFPTLSTRDLLHVAVMVGNDLATIISVDSDFDRVPLIKRVDPRQLIDEQRALLV